MPPVVVIVFRSPFIKYFFSYISLGNNFDEILSSLKKIINTEYANARRHYPESHIIIVWNEYGIVANISGKCAMLSIHTKKLFQTEMHNLLLDKNNITIIAGTISYARDMFYKRNFSAQNVYDKYESVLKLNEEQIIKESSISAMQVLRNKNIDHYVRVKNICYIFTKTNNEILLDKQEKISPFHEESYYASCFPQTERFFQPGTYTKIITFDKRYHLTLAIEICFDHKCGMLRKQCEAGLPTPNLHLLVSASIKSISHNIVAKDYFIHADINSSEIKQCGSNKNFTVIPHIISPARTFLYTLSK